MWGRWLGADWTRRVPAFLMVGLAATAAYLLLYLVLSPLLGAQVANVLALVVTTLADTSANRRHTFGVRDQRSAVSHQVLGLVVLLAGTAITAGSLSLLTAVVASPSTLIESAVLVVANAVAGIVRFAAFAVAMRDDVRRLPRERVPASAGLVSA